MHVKVESDKLQLIEMQSPLANGSPDTTLLKQPLEESACRICFEQGSRSNNLITPCRCFGSVRYVHEECLKLWLLSSKGQDISLASCELCKTPYLMEMKVAWRCSSNNLFTDKLMLVCFLPLLMMVFVVLIYILMVLFQQYFDDDSQDQSQRNCTLVIIGTCFCTMGVVIYLTFSMLKEVCCLHSLKYWSIRPQNFISNTPINIQIQREMPPVLPDLSEKVPNRAHSTDKSRSLAPEFIIPKKVKIKGVLVSPPPIRSETLDILRRSDGSFSLRPMSNPTLRAITSRVGNYCHTVSCISDDSALRL